MEPSLTQPECLQIAQKDFGKNATLINYHIKPVSDEKRGFLGEYFTLELQVKDVSIFQLVINYGICFCNNVASYNVAPINSEILLLSSGLDKNN